MIDLGINSYYSHSPMNWFSNYKNRPRTCSLKKSEEFVLRKYIVTVNGGDWWEDKEAMIEWCNKQFGHHNERYNNPRWQPAAFEFRFKNEKDAMLFMLRWG